MPRTTSHLSDLHSYENIILLSIYIQQQRFLLKKKKKELEELYRNGIRCSGDEWRLLFFRRETLNNNDLNQVADQRFAATQRSNAGHAQMGTFLGRRAPISRAKI